MCPTLGEMPQSASHVYLAKSYMRAVLQLRVQNPVSREVYVWTFQIFLLNESLGQCPLLLIPLGRCEMRVVHVQVNAHEIHALPSFQM